MRVTANCRLAGASPVCRTPTSFNCNAATSAASITTTRRPSLRLSELSGLQLESFCFSRLIPLGRMNSRRSCSEVSVSLSPLVADGCWISWARARLSPSIKAGGVSTKVGVSGASATPRTMISTASCVSLRSPLLCSVATTRHSKLGSVPE